MNAAPASKHLAPLLCCLAAAILLTLPILGADWYVANQAYRYPYLLSEFREQFLAGQWYPRWLPGLAGGYGYPTFLYYPPGFWFFCLPLALVLPSPVLACKIALVALLALGGLGAYRLARRFAPGWAAYAAAMAFFLSPQLHYALFFRGALSELAATMLLPWIFLALLKLTHSNGNALFRQSLALALLLAACAYTHPIVTVWLALTLLLLTPALLAASRHPKRALAALACTAGLSLSLSAAYWWPALSLKAYVHYERGILDELTFQSLPLSGIFASHSPYLGPWQPLLALAGLALTRSAFARAALACYLAYTLYMTPWADDIRKTIPALGLLQWPARLLPVLLPLNAIGLALLLPRLQKRGKPAALAALALMAFGISAHYGIRENLDYGNYANSRRHSFEDMTHKAEFTPRTVRYAGLRPRGPAGPIATVSPGAVLATPRNIADTDIALRVEAQNPVQVTISQFAFPGWQVSQDGRKLPYCIPDAQGSYCHDANGRITVALPAGNHNIEAQYAGPPAAHGRNAAMLAASLLFLLGLRRISRSAHSPVASGTR